MMNSNMARFGSRLIANGYAILPIAPGTKKPGRYLNKEWRDYPDWTRHSTRATTDVEVETWSNWPDAGIGVVGGAIAAIDIDIAEDAILALEIDELARKMLGDTPAIRIGKAPKRVLVYRTTKPFKGIKRHPLEILCVGQQFVAHAIHPETGEPYTWPNETLADLDIGALPEIDEAKARAFLEAAYALLPEHLRKSTLGKSTGHVSERMPAHQGTMPAVHAALTYLPNAELDYDSWIRVGLAIKGALGEDGFVLFAAWSSQAAKNDPATTLKMWAGFKPNSLGAGTIYHLAMERGWKPDSALVLDGSIETDQQHPAAKLIDKLKMEDSHLDQDIESVKAVIQVPPPPSLDRLDGALKLMVGHILDTAIRPQPLLAVGASLAALGTIMGRRVKTESNLRTNLYVLGIAESGGGKDHARKAIKEIFVQAGLQAHLGGERLASGAGLISALTRQPSSLFQIDEFGKFMANVIDKRRAPKHLSEIWDLFTELATSAGTTFLGAEYADQRERPRQDIVEPCASIHGVSAPGPFWETLNSSAMQDGSLARFLVFRSEDDIPDRNRKLKSVSEISVELFETILAIANCGASSATGNLAAVSAPAIKPSVLTVPMDDKARKLFDVLDEDLTARQRAAIGSDHSAVLARIWENTAKIALIKAVSANPAAPVIRGIDAQWAKELVEHCCATLFVQADRHIADNDIERAHKRMLELVREAGKHGIRHNDLTRKCQSVEPKLRREIIQSLIESDQIEAESKTVGGRKGTTYKMSRQHNVNVKHDVN